MFKKALIAGATVLASVGAHAVSADLTVAGTIVPEACTVLLGNNGKIDYGTLSVKTVKDHGLWFGTHYFLPTKNVDFNVNCPSPAPIVVSVIDNRASAKEAGLPIPDIKFGLSDTAGSSVGFFEVETPSIKIMSTRSAAPQTAVEVLARAVGTTGPFYLRTSDAAHTYLAQNLTYGYKVSAGGTRTASDITPVQNLTGTLRVSPRITKARVDDAKSDFQFIGSLTMMFEYI